MGRGRLGGLGGLVALGVALGGCSDPKLVQMTQVRDEVCKCLDAACVDAALAKLPARGPRAERSAQRVAQEIVRCVANVAEIDPAGTEDSSDDSASAAGSGAAGSGGSGEQAPPAPTAVPAPSMQAAPRTPPK